MKPGCPTNYLAVISFDNYKTHCSPLLQSAALKGICLFLKWKVTTENISTVTKSDLSENVTEMSVKGSRAGRSYEICLKHTKGGKKRLLFQLYQKEKERITKTH